MYNGFPSSVEVGGKTAQIYNVSRERERAREGRRGRIELTIRHVLIIRNPFIRNRAPRAGERAESLEKQRKTMKTKRKITTKKSGEGRYVISITRLVWIFHLRVLTPTTNDREPERKQTVRTVTSTSRRRTRRRKGSIASRRVRRLVGKFLQLVVDYGSVIGGGGGAIIVRSTTDRARR